MGVQNELLRFGIGIAVSVADDFRKDVKGILGKKGALEFESDVFQDFNGWNNLKI